MFDVSIMPESHRKIRILRSKEVSILVSSRSKFHIAITVDDRFPFFVCSLFACACCRHGPHDSLESLGGRTFACDYSDGVVVKVSNIRRSMQCDSNGHEITTYTRSSFPFTSHSNDTLQHCRLCLCVCVSYVGCVCALVNDERKFGPKISDADIRLCTGYKLRCKSTQQRTPTRAA